MSERLHVTDQEFILVIETALIRMGSRTAENLPAQRALVAIMRIFNTQLRPAVGLPSLSEDEIDFEEIEKQIDSNQEALDALNRVRGKLLQGFMAGKGREGVEELMPGVWTQDGALYVDAEVMLKARGIEVTPESVNAIRQEIEAISRLRSIPLTTIRKKDLP